MPQSFTVKENFKYCLYICTMEFNPVTICLTGLNSVTTVQWTTWNLQVTTFIKEKWVFSLGDS